MASSAIACTIGVILAALLYLAARGFAWGAKPGRKEIQRLRGAEERLRLLTSCSGDIAWELDGSGKVMSVSPEISAIMGYGPEEIAGSMPHDVVAGSASMSAVLQCIGAKKGEVFSCFLTFRHKKGYNVYCQARGQKTFGPGGAFSGYIGILRDISEQVLHSKLARHNEKVMRRHSAEYKRLYEQFMEQNKRTNEIAARLGEASEDIKSVEKKHLEFIAGAVHEIVAPVLAIKRLSELIASDGESGQFKGVMLQQLAERTSYMMELSSDLTDYDMIAKGCMRISISTGNISELISSLYDFHYFRNLYNDKKPVSLKISIDLPSNAHSVRSDFRRLRQILSTLILQAYRFEGVSKIWLRCCLVDCEIQFSVSDNGAGIPASSYKHIFTPYMYWSQIAGKDSGAAHTAISLSICKQLAEMMGGRLWFESEQNSGSTFHLAIPYIKPLEIGDAKPAQYCWRGHTILLMGYSPYANALVSSQIMGTGARLGCILLSNASEPSPTCQAFANYFSSVSLILIGESAASHPSAATLAKRYPAAPVMLVADNPSIEKLCKEIDMKLSAQNK